MRDDFPLLKNIHYLDNAATTQKPLCVIDRVCDFYKGENANSGRGIYSLSVNASASLQKARAFVASFIGAGEGEVFFTKNATEGFNLLAGSFEVFFKKKFSNASLKGNVVSTIIEHHSNFLPWQNLSSNLGFDFRVAKDFNNLEDSVLELVDSNTRVVAFSAMSNVSGLVVDVASLSRRIKEKNKDCFVVVDVAQAVAHNVLDVKVLGCDFLVFSGHKVYGPLGVGVVFGKRSFLDVLNPVLFGGGMVRDFRDGSFIFEDAPSKFEAGSLDVSAIVGLAEALSFFSNVKDRFVLEDSLLKFTISQLREINGINIVGHDSSKFGPVISFTLDGVHPHDLASIADSFNVCIRAGHLCAKPFLSHLGLDAVCRVSLSFYNDEVDILKLVDVIKKAKVIFQ